ncbi:hypothetical protein AB0G32_17795 [Streptomyces sp. NPDC023723]|uniref:hypothetical protein n=1 Tax=Streptomyces sp. NPDC023723 TaxID=3154323 RepID=UPI0033CD6268
MVTHDELRLLPWAGPDGKPCYLSTNTGDGFVSRLADHVEEMQLRMASKLLEEALQVLTDGKAGSDELSLLVAQLAGALKDVLRVGTSRGHRLEASEPL